MPPPLEYWDNRGADDEQPGNESDSSGSPIESEDEYKCDDEIIELRASLPAAADATKSSRCSASATIPKSVEVENEPEKEGGSREPSINMRKIVEEVATDHMDISTQVSEGAGSTSRTPKMVSKGTFGQGQRPCCDSSAQLTDSDKKTIPVSTVSTGSTVMQMSTESSSDPSSPIMRKCIAAAIQNIARQENAATLATDSANTSIDSSDIPVDDELITSKHQIPLAVTPASWSSFRDTFGSHKQPTQSKRLESELVSPLCTTNSATALETKTDTGPSTMYGLDSVLVHDVEEKIHAQRISVIAPDFRYPPSKYSGAPKERVWKEYEVVDNFMEEAESIEDFDNPYYEFDLEDFSIYLPGSNQYHPDELTSLHRLYQDGHSTYLFEGFLCLDGERRYVEGVPFQTVSAHGYGKERAECGPIWIQSMYNQKGGREIYYRLKKPHRRYARFHEAYMWLANLRKHFVDYALETCEAGNDVSIHNFRKDFSDWLLREQGDSPQVIAWHSAYGKTDFATAVAANIEFLVHDAVQTYSMDHLKIWSEIRNQTLIKTHKAVVKGVVVTPYVYECFKDMPFGRHLKKVTPCSLSEFRRKSMGDALHMTTDADVVQSAIGLDPNETARQLARGVGAEFRKRTIDLASIKVGDVLAVQKDHVESTNWKEEGNFYDFWVIYVQAIETLKSGLRAFRILWLYSPPDTTCAIMKYPYPNELFMSNLCECDKLSDHWVTEDEVICRVSIAWSGTHTCKEDFFVRQTFDKIECSFQTFSKEHTICQCLKPNQMPFQHVATKYNCGETVLVKRPRSKRLEPVEIVSFDADSYTVTVKQLLRRSEVHGDSNIQPNELLYSERLVPIKPEDIHHRCYVRFFAEEQARKDEIPHPYNRDGSCDFFYICLRIMDGPFGDVYEAIDPESPPPSLVPGYDLKDSPLKNKMRGLDLFCGGGNMGKGIEDGGAVHFTHACDWEGNALASYYANTGRPELTNFYNGSVNDLLSTAMAGNPRKVSGVPAPGDIEFISAGSPCVGFSAMNPDKQTNKALANQALVANVAAMIEFYRPRFAILENVVSMAQKGKNRKHDSLSQLICCLVGMGYQLQVRLLDAWSFGCPQSRSRLFVVIAAPGFVLPEHPHLSHSHIDCTKEKSLGKMANGLDFGKRRSEPTAFEWVSARQGTADLPSIGDGQVYHCTKFPDHRMPIHLTEKHRMQFSLIPMHPPGQNLAKVYPTLSTEERILFATRDKYDDIMKPAKVEGSKAYGRIKGDHVFPTITTACAPSEKRNGVRLHWEEPRVMTIMEAKRAQGFLDSDVLTGTAADRYKIIGNSVARQVAHAEGLAFREAWLKSVDDNPPVDAPLLAVASQVPSAFSTARSTPARNLSDASQELYSQAMLDLKLNSTLNSDEDNTRFSVASEPSRESSREPSQRRSKMAIEIPARNSICYFDSGEEMEIAEASPISELEAAREQSLKPTPSIVEPMTAAEAEQAQECHSSPAPGNAHIETIKALKGAERPAPLAEVEKDAFSGSAWTPINGRSSSKRRSELFQAAAKRQKVTADAPATSSSESMGQSKPAPEPTKSIALDQIHQPQRGKQLWPNPFRMPLPDRRIARPVSARRVNQTSNTPETAVMIDSDEERNFGLNGVDERESTPVRKTVKVIKPRSRTSAARKVSHQLAVPTVTPRAPSASSLAAQSRSAQHSRHTTPQPQLRASSTHPSFHLTQNSPHPPSQRPSPRRATRIEASSDKAPKDFVIDLTGDSDEEAPPMRPKGVPMYQPFGFPPMMSGYGMPQYGYPPPPFMMQRMRPMPVGQGWGPQGFQPQRYGPALKPSIERAGTPSERRFR